MKIDKVDKNLIVNTEIQEENIAFYDVKNDPFKIYGLYNPQKEDVFKRMPSDIAKATSEGVYILHTNTAGGRVRFKTDSEYVAISVKVRDIHLMSHMALAGISGFDMYVKDENGYKCEKTFFPCPNGVTSPLETEKRGGYEGIYHFGERKMRDITLNFPLYNDVQGLFVGVEENAEILEGDLYKYDKPIVCYGSSITQGGCASRPGNAYSNILSRMFDADVYNLGFSGSAEAEDVMADYIAGLDMKVFIYDYDYNAPSDEHLKNTHEKMFKKIREKNPDLPVIMISRPDYHYSEKRENRRAIIKTTYQNALDAGDKNVYFINGSEFFAECGDSATVDNCHPNDLGFMCMAKRIAEVLKEIL